VTFLRAEERHVRPLRREYVPVDENRRAQLLGKCRLFAGLPQPELQRLAAAAGTRRYKRGQLLFSEGDSGDSLLILVEGSLKAVSSSAAGEELLLEVVQPHDAVGELSVADGGARSASVSAVTDSVVLRIPRDAVLATATGSRALTEALLASLATTVRRLTGTAGDLVFLDIPRRVAKLVLSLRQDGDVVRAGLTQAEMADRVGASRQSLNAALQDFQRRGWVTIGAREIRLRDVPALRRFVGD
jgi:CRP/FNR family transcriptional regulator, cyclic AMP receptor protein